VQKFGLDAMKAQTVSPLELELQKEKSQLLAILAADVQVERPA
jgi:hypothetical protein